MKRNTACVLFDILVTHLEKRRKVSAYLPQNTYTPRGYLLKAFS